MIKTQCSSQQNGQEKLGAVCSIRELGAVWGLQGAVCSVGRCKVQCAVWGEVESSVQCGEAVKPCVRHLDSVPALTRQKAIDVRHHPGVVDILINQDFHDFQ